MTSKKAFKYKAIDNNGNYKRGTILAFNAKVLHQQLLDNNLHLISSTTHWRFVKELNRADKIPSQEMLDFCLHMQYMDQAGVPLLDALEDAKIGSLKLQPVLEDIISSIRSGKLFSQAIASHKTIFSPMFVQIISLAEQSGKLFDGFGKLYQHLSWNEQNRREISKNIRYPAIVFLLICCVIWMMSTFVIPQMHDLLSMSGTETPASSKLILSINQSLLKLTPVFATGMALTFLILLGLRFLSFKQRILQDKYIIKMPWIGPLLHKRDISLFLHFFHACLSSHLDLLESITHSKDAIKNQWIQRKIAQCLNDINEGDTLSKAMQKTQIFSASTLRLVQVGEVTGQLIPLLAILENYHSRDLKRQIEKTMGYLQPALLGFIGLVLIWIVLGIFYPMYDQLFTLEGSI